MTVTTTQLFEYLKGEKFTMTCTLSTSRRLLSHPWVASHGDYPAQSVSHSPALAGQKGTSGMTLWSRCKESIMFAPLGASAIFPPSVYPPRWDSQGGSQELGLVSGAICFQNGLETHIRTERLAIWTHHIMRVVNVPVKRVIDRWRGEPGGRSIRNPERWRWRCHGRTGFSKPSRVILWCARQCQSVYLPWPVSPNRTSRLIVSLFHVKF